MQSLANKTVKTYLQKISLKAAGTVSNIRAALTKLDTFTLEQRGKTLDEFMQEIKGLDQESQFDVLFEHLQNFVNTMDKQGIVSQGARNYLYSIKGFVRYCGIKVHKEDLKEHITFRRIEKQDREPITKEQLRLILENASPQRKALYLTMSSSGMRPRETLQLRKRDFDLSLERIKVNIPAKYTKTKKSRLTFVSKEAENYLKPILATISDDDLVFGTSDDPKRSIGTEEEYFNRIRTNLCLTDTYDSGTHRITLGGSLRSWFITKANRIDYGFGHALAGHDQYMKTYDRLELKDKLALYIKTEPTLSVYDVPASEPKTAELEAKITLLEDEVFRKSQAIDGIQQKIAEMENKLNQNKSV